MDLQKARQLLRTGEYTCVLWGSGEVITSTRRGVAPLLELIDQKKNVQGYRAADKVVGKATALLYCLLGVRAVYADVISASARQVLEANGIETAFGSCVPYIQNRSGTGCCPMEKATERISQPEAALLAVRRTLKLLQEGKEP